MKRQTNQIIFFLSLLLMVGSASLMAAEKPHLHGAANLEITYVDDRLEIMIDSPADNLFGFEYPPVHQDDQKTVRHAVDAFFKKVKLNLPKTCRPEGFSFEGNGFTVDDNLKVKFGSEEHSEDSEDADDHDEEEKHSDVEINLTYQCRPDDKVKTIDFETLFKTFKGFEEIEAAIITDTKQDHRDLTPKNTVLVIPQ